MSLDVTLYSVKTILKKSSGIFIRQGGQTLEITEEKWSELFPDREPVRVIEDEESNVLFSANITHNLGLMAAEAGIYKHLWRPEELEITTAKELISPLKKGLAVMKQDADHYKTFNASNGWGLYKHFIPWIENYLNACIEYPDAEVHVSR